MKLSLSNGIFSRCKLEENFAHITKLGFENIEFNMKTVKREHEEAVYVAKRLLDEYGLNCLTLHSASHYVGDEIEIPKAVYYVKVSAEFAYRLQAPTMVIHSNALRRIPEELRCKFIGQILRELVPYARNLGVKLALENLSYASRGYGKNVPELEQILSIADDANMGITIDFSHATATGVADSLLEKFHDHLYNIHMSNRTHKPFEEQASNLAAFMATLHKYDYQGPLTMELSRKCTTDDIMKTKAVLEKMIATKNILQGQ